MTEEKIDYAAVNLGSYEGAELLSNFPDRKSLEVYRRKKLDSCRPAVEFVKSLFGRTITVFEIGSGNSKLLYNLWLCGLLERGFGVEVSRSRHAFAEAWKKELNANAVSNINADILEMKIENYRNVDLFVCVDITFQFFYPIQKDSDARLLRQICSSLKAGGYLILELWSMENTAKGIALGNGVYRAWEEFDAADPFRYSLHHYSFDADGNVILKKTFLPRDSSKPVSVMTNVLRPYSSEKISEMLHSAGFQEVKIYSDFELNAYDRKKDEYLVVARKLV